VQDLLLLKERHALFWSPPAATQEVADMKLEYLPPSRLGLAKEDVPRSRWPAPRAHLPPFHDGFTDYLRAAAPGVYVG
jgi:hypothetical protein